MEPSANMQRENNYPESFYESEETSRNLQKLRNIGEGERLISLVGGLGLLMAGLARRGFGGVILGALGAAMIQRGVTSHCALYQSLGVSSASSQRPGVPDNVGLNLERSIIVNRPREEVYAFWRHLPNLALAMKHIQRVELLDEHRSHWEILTPHGRRLEWNAVIINDHPNELIAWESEPGAKVENAGSVRFEPEPHGQGTVVIVKLEYNPPGGLLGRVGGALLGEKAGREIEEDLRQWKRMMESEEPAQP